MNDDVVFALLASLGMFVLLGLIYALFRPRQRPVPPFRTANAHAMERQVQRLQAKVPSAERRRVRAGQPPAPPAASETTTIRAAAVAAALRDIGKPLSTANPYRPGSWAGNVWDAHYRRVTRDNLVASQQAAQSLRTDAQA